jgi:tryptophan-rich sensory protein
MAVFTRAIAHRDATSGRWHPHLPVNLVALIGFGAVSAIAGIIAVEFVDSGAGSWYASLTKPKFEPPSNRIGVILVGLYATAALAGWLVWRRSGPRMERGRALAVFGVLLVLSATWTPVLFSAQDPELALLVVAALWLAALGALTTFAPVDAWAAVLLVPWFGWVTYAAALNVAIVLLN